MNSLYALYALRPAASHLALMSTTCMAQLTTVARHWSHGVIAATPKKPDASKPRKPRPVKGCDENGIPLDPNHHWNREKSPATELYRTAHTLRTRGRS